LICDFLIYDFRQLKNHKLQISPMPLRFQLATEKDVPQLIQLMREFYQNQGMLFDEEVARSGLNKTLLDPTLGSVYLIVLDDQLAGYFALTACFSLEFHGKCGLLDELYVREPFRRRNLGKAAVEFATEICRKMGIKALRLEVGEQNKVAQSLYQSLGFERDVRHLFTKRL
jgi:ribosomal protein S18 acetylase RimI-like enzyme